ncbi:MAG: hypothetical protein HYT16_00465 [DPANN group archaeon]|nr:hypothetical protein [DPANN group archaeon]
MDEGLENLVSVELPEASAKVLRNEMKPEGWLRFDTKEEWASHIGFVLQAMGYYNKDMDGLADDSRYAPNWREITIFQTHPDDIALAVGAAAHKFARFGRKVTGVTMCLQYQDPNTALDRCLATLEEAKVLGFESMTGKLSTEQFVAVLRPIVSDYNELKARNSDKTVLQKWVEQNVVPVYYEYGVAVDSWAGTGQNPIVMRETIYTHTKTADAVFAKSTHDRNGDHYAAALAAGDGGRSIVNLFRYGGPEYTIDFKPTTFVRVGLEDFAAKMLALQFHQEVYGKTVAGEHRTLSSVDKLAETWPRGRRFYFHLDTQLGKALYWGKWVKGGNVTSPCLAEGLEVETMAI